uniref:Uncharacterized protein n=1 Tax=Romanomermis culicivorax TaxID=13658 RepID=A0A915I292_ROMCU
MAEYCALPAQKQVFKSWVGRSNDPCTKCFPMISKFSLLLLKGFLGGAVAVPPLANVRFKVKYYYSIRRFISQHSRKL